MDLKRKIAVVVLLILLVGSIIIFFFYFNGNLAGKAFEFNPQEITSEGGLVYIKNTANNKYLCGDSDGKIKVQGSQTGSSNGIVMYKIVETDTYNVLFCDGKEETFGANPKSTLWVMQQIAGNSNIKNYWFIHKTSWKALAGDIKKNIIFFFFETTLTTSKSWGVVPSSVKEKYSLVLKDVGGNPICKLVSGKADNGPSCVKTGLNDKDSSAEWTFEVGCYKEIVSKEGDPEVLCALGTNNACNKENLNKVLSIGNSLSQVVCATPDQESFFWMECNMDNAAEKVGGINSALGGPLMFDPNKLCALNYLQEPQLVKISENICLTAEGDGQPGNKAIVRNCLGGNNQKWFYDSLTMQVKRGLSLCLEEGTNGPVINNCNANNNQKWDLNFKTKELKSFSGKCLSIGVVQSGQANLQSDTILLNCDGSYSQKWNFQTITENWFSCPNENRGIINSFADSNGYLNDAVCLSSSEWETCTEKTLGVYSYLGNKNSLLCSRKENFKGVEWRFCSDGTFTYLKNVPKNKINIENDYLNGFVCRKGEWLDAGKLVENIAYYKLDDDWSGGSVRADPVRSGSAARSAGISENKAKDTYGNYDGISTLAVKQLEGYAASSKGGVFAGDDTTYLTLPKEVLNGRNVFTISLWMKPEAMKGGIVSGANAAGDNEFLIYLDMQGSEPIIEVMLKGESGIFKVKGFVNLKEWNLITLQRKENKVWLYSGQSNNLIGEFTFSEKAKGSLKVDSLIIGQEQDLNKAGQKEVGILGNVKFTVDKNQAFKGMLDEVKFNTGLSKAVSGAQKELEMCSVAGDEDQDGKSDCDDEDCFENTKCVPPIKLLAQYDFETLEKAGTSDHKIVKDSIEPYSDGKAFSAIGQLLLKDGSKAGEFPGDTSSYVEIPPEVASAMKVFSITFWFRTVKGGTIIASENDQLKIYLEQVFDRGSDDLKITLGGKELVYQMDNSEGGVFDGEWHSLTVTRNRRFVKAYVDAKELLPAEKDQAKNIVNDDELQLKNLILGQGLKSGYFMKDKAFSGTLDTLKFYQGILHITSINMNQAKTKPVEPEIKEGESSGTETGKTESDCTDGKDEDQDGKVDCLDSDCYGKKGPKGLICCYSGTDDPEEDGKACSYEKAWCDTEGVTGSYQCYQCLPGEWECDDTGNKGMTCQEGKCAAELSPDLTGSGIDKDGDGVLDEYEPPECINPSFISVYKVYDEKNKGISSSYSSSNKDFIKVFAGCLKGDIGGGEKSSPNLKVDESDFAPFIGQYLLGKEGKMSKVSRGDVNQDGKVDESDFAPFIGEYLKNKEKK